MKHLTRLGLALTLLFIVSLPPATASCTVTRPCAGASSISCSGTTCQSGSAGTGWVQCDSGPTTYCPLCVSDGSCNRSSCYSDPDCCYPGAICTQDSECGEGGLCDRPRKRCYC